MVVSVWSRGTTSGVSALTTSPASGVRRVCGALRSLVFMECTARISKMDLNVSYTLQRSYRLKLCFDKLMISVLLTTKYVYDKVMI